jgi:hypothetical protein
MRLYALAALRRDREQEQWIFLQLTKKLAYEELYRQSGSAPFSS